MKTLVTFLLIFCSSLVHSQIKYGVLAGAGMARFKFDDSREILTPPKVNYHMGFFFSKGFVNSTKLKAEIKYYPSVNVDLEYNGNVVETAEKISYFTAPVQYGIKLGKQNIYLSLGIAFNFYLFGNWEDFDLLDEGDQLYDAILPFFPGEEDLFTFAKSNNIGFTGKLNIEYDITKKLAINLFFETYKLEVGFLDDNLFLIDTYDNYNRSEYFFRYATLGVSVNYALSK